MKKFHEIACIVNNSGDRVGYLVLDTENNIKQFIDESQFAEYCKMDDMQYFAWDYEKQNYKVFYTNEELKAMGKAAKIVQKCDNMESYFSSDVTLLEEHVALQKRYPELLIGTVLSPMSLPLIGSFLSIYLFGNESATANWLAKASASIKKVTRTALNNVDIIVTVTAKQLPYFSADLKGILVNPIQLIKKPEILTKEFYSGYSEFVVAALNSGKDTGIKQAFSFFVENNERTMTSIGSAEVIQLERHVISESRNVAPEKEISDMNVF